MDVTAVRCRHSQELPFEDSKALKIPSAKVDVVLAEAKRGDVSALSNSWNSSEKPALEYVVRRVGVVPSKKVDEVCASLCESRHIILDDLSFRAVCCAVL
jgi:hypothetical protein